MHKRRSKRILNSSVHTPCPAQDPADNRHHEFETDQPDRQTSHTNIDPSTVPRTPPGPDPTAHKPAAYISRDSKFGTTRAITKIPGVRTALHHTPQKKKQTQPAQLLRPHKDTGTHKDQQPPTAYRKPSESETHQIRSRDETNTDFV